MKKIFFFVLFFLAFSAAFYRFDFIKRYKKTETKKKPPQKLPKLRVDTLTAVDISLQRSSIEFFDKILLKSGFNGAMLVSRAGKIIFEKYNGLKELTKGQSIDSLTSFHLASVSKTFTAMAILKLFEKGLLKLDDEVANYLTEFPFKGVTIRDLLCHRSGLQNYLYFIDEIDWNRDSLLTNQDLLNIFINHKRKLTPSEINTHFDYSNTNYVLLALIVEKTTKLSLGKFLEQTFFKPLGMTNSFVFSKEMADSVLLSYNPNDKLEPFTYMDGLYGDKNIYSSARDLLKWSNAIFNSNLFPKNILDEAFKGYSNEKKGIKNYGLGWRLYEMTSGKKIIYHNGWWHGNNTVFMNLPSDSAVIIVLGNKYNEKIYEAKIISNTFEGYDFETHDDY